MPLWKDVLFFILSWLCAFGFGRFPYMCFVDKRKLGARILFSGIIFLFFFIIFIVYLLIRSLYVNLPSQALRSKSNFSKSLPLREL